MEKGAGAKAGEGFKKDFYTEHPEVSAMSDSEVPRPRPLLACASAHALARNTQHPSSMSVLPS